MAALDYSKVADLYDLYARTDVDVGFFLQEAKGCRSVLELTCGTGRLSLPLLQAGVPLSCLDNSPEMLDVLRHKLKAAGLAASIYEMDATCFSLAQRFDLIIIPFNSFAEFTDPQEQKAALATIRSHLTDGGRLICTLHNPEVRLKSADGQLHARGRFASGESQVTLFLSTLEWYEADRRLVTGVQFYELYDRNGVMQSKRFVDLRFYVHTHGTFEALAKSHGYEVIAMYGDYDRTDYLVGTSSFMIWVLGK